MSRFHWADSIRVVVLITALGVAPAAWAEDAAPVSYGDLVSQAKSKTEAKDWKAAASLWEKVTKANPVDGGNWSNLAKARYEAKEYRKAIEANEKVIETGLYFPWSAPYDIACCYALLGEKEQALTWLQKSFVKGYRDLAHAQKDEDLKILRDDPRFRDLVALVDTSKMSREEGWRYDLSLLAREIKRLHYSPFHLVSRETFDEAVRKLHDQIPKLSDHQIEVGLMKIMCMAGDGHSRLIPKYLTRQARRAAPVRFYLFEEGLFIIAADPAHKDLAGAQVLKVGEHPVDEVLKAMEPIIFRDNSYWAKLIGPDWLPNAQILDGLGLIPDGSQLPLTIRDASGKEREVKLPVDAGDPTNQWVRANAGSSQPDPLYRKNRTAAYWYEYLKDSKTVFFQFSAVRNEAKQSFSDFCKELFKFIDEHDVDRLVIDMRFNGGGNTFLTPPLIHGLIRCRKLEKEGSLFVIIGRQTFSAAINTTVAIERNTKAIMVGEPTGSSPNFIGESVEGFLPYSGIRTTTSDLYWESSWPMDHRNWIAPTLYAPPTFADYRNNRDPALEAIMAYKANK